MFRGMFVDFQRRIMKQDRMLPLGMNLPSLHIFLNYMHIYLHLILSVLPKASTDKLEILRIVPKLYISTSLQQRYTHTVALRYSVTVPCLWNDGREDQEHVGQSGLMQPR